MEGLLAQVKFFTNAKKALPPSGGNTEAMNRHDDNALEATAPTPQDYGFPANPSTVNKQCWVRQEAFLAAYGELGTILHAARVAGIHRDTVNKWISADCSAPQILDTRLSEVMMTKRRGTAW
jgi:hypothetical protein